MLINELKVKAKKKKKTVGRGGVHGTYSTRGGKGQTARSGSSFYLGFEGGRSGLRKQLHKLGGFKSIYAKPQIVNLNALESNFNDGDIITKQALVEKKLIKDNGNAVKILGNGEISKKLAIKKLLASQSVRSKIEAAGGNVT